MELSFLVECPVIVAILLKIVKFDLGVIDSAKSDSIRSDLNHSTIVTQLNL